MFSSDEIKARYENGITIDRHGFEVIQFSDMQESTLYLRLAHYHLLDGVPAKQIQERLESDGISPFEAKTVVEEALAFIKDVLCIDLAARIKDQKSTTSACNRQLRENVESINLWYDLSRFAPIEVGGCLFDADNKSREALNNALTTSSVPSYWVDATNARVEEWTTVRARQLLSEITKRDNDLHQQMTEMKYAQRTACEEVDFLTLQHFKVPM